VPSLPGELAALVLTGAFSTGFMATGNTTLQLTADPRFRGRVMALWSVTFTGTTPVGGPLVGVVADDHGPRYGLGLGAAACLAATLIGAAAPRHAYSCRGCTAWSRAVPEVKVVGSSSSRLMDKGLTRKPRPCETFIHSQHHGHETAAARDSCDRESPLTRGVGS
jgi:MFS family permease